jgi:hypothetical protein
MWLAYIVPLQFTMKVREADTSKQRARSSAAKDTKAHGDYQAFAGRTVDTIRTRIHQTQHIHHVTVWPQQLACYGVLPNTLAASILHHCCRT